MNTTNQPYGNAGGTGPARKLPQLRQFGIAYIAIRGVLLVLSIIAMLFFASLMTPDMVNDEVALSLTIAIIVPLAWLAYAGTGGVLAMNGHVSGAYMGLTDVVLSTLLALVSLFGGNIGGGFCLLVTNGVIAVLAVKSIQEVNRGIRQPQAAAPAYGAAPYASQPAQAGYPTQPQPQAPTNAPAPQAQSAVEQHATASIPSTKAAALGVLQLAASLDPDRAPQALQRARAVGLKLLGPTGKVRVQRQLAGPATIMDLDHDLWQYCWVLSQHAGERMKADVIRAAQVVLNAPDGEMPLAGQFMATLKNQLGTT